MIQEANIFYARPSLYSKYFTLRTRVASVMRNSPMVNHLHPKQNANTKTCLYNFDSLKSHFYIVKLGFTGVHIIFLISA